MRKKPSVLALLIIYECTNEHWMYTQLTREIGSQYSKYIHRRDTYTTYVVDKGNIDFINPHWLLSMLVKLKWIKWLAQCLTLNKYSPSCWKLERVATWKLQVSSKFIYCLHIYFIFWVWLYFFSFFKRKFSFLLV